MTHFYQKTEPYILEKQIQAEVRIDFLQMKTAISLNDFNVHKIWKQPLHHLIHPLDEVLLKQTMMTQ